MVQQISYSAPIMADAQQAPNICLVAVTFTAVQLHATVPWPSTAGCTTTFGADHPGDDIGCYGGTDVNSAAFSHLTNNSASGEVCAK